MITGYEKQIIRGEKVLILYLNYDSEFGMDFRLHHKIGNMKKEIKKYLTDKNIKLSGEKIALSFGGIILAVLLLVENPTIADDLNFVYVSDHIIPNEVTQVLEPEIKEEILENKDDVVSNDTQVEDNNNNNDKIDNDIVKEEINNNIKNEIIKTEQTSSSTNILDNIKQEPVEIDKESDNNFLDQVTVYRTSGSVITLSIDEYLIGVVGAEMPASFNIEALKAQAVVARTYALKKIARNEKLTDSVSTQSYKDNIELKKDWGDSFDTYYEKIKTAVLSTKDLAIYYQNELIDAVYHSTSNGKTEDSIYVWGNSLPYLKSVNSSWDKDATTYLRDVNKDFNTVLTLLGIDINDNLSFEILSRDDSGRVLEIKIGNKTFTGVEFRNLLGLRSADFDLSLENGILNITTRGYGHGVGLSQYGANGMAKQGYTFDKILKHYYTGVSIY